MALTVNHPFNEAVIYGQVANVSSTSVVYVPAPTRGKIIKVGAVVSSTVSTAPATVTTSIAGTNITGGVFTIASAATAGTVNTAVPTAANTCNEDDYIGFVVSGSGTAGGPVTCFAVIRKYA